MTIQQVAKKAGVSTATVSRMINKNGFVSDEAREKIRLAIKETGFDLSQRRRRRISDASSLQHRKLAMIWTSGIASQQTLTGQQIMQGITEALRDTNIRLTIDHIDSTNYIPQSLLEKDIDGILVLGSTPSAEICSHLKNFPLVWLLQQGATDFGDRVQPDHSLAGKIAFNYLTLHGKKNLCCITPSPDQKFSKSRADSFFNHARETGTQTVLLKHESPETNTPSMLAALAAGLVDEFTKLTPRPDGLFITDNLGPYIHQELIKKGIIPMKDILIVAGDKNLCSQHHLDPDPVTIRIFSNEIGKLAVAVLLQRIKNTSMPQVTCSLKPELIIPK